MMLRNLRVLVVLVAGCSIGAPPGFSPAESWTIPLVGPLENGVMVTPVTIAGHGPYLFQIDPDALVSAVDSQVVHDAQLWNALGARPIDETDTSRPRFYAEMVDVKIGSLTIERRSAMVFKPGTYDTEGRHINGILGRDVLADSLVFGFDRDQGIAMLSTVRSFHPPAGAVAVAYEMTGGASSTEPRPPWMGRRPLPWTQRHLAQAEIGGRRFTMHLDLGAAVSQLAESKWAAAGLAPAAVHLRLTDEAATVRQVAHAAIAAQVMLDGAVSGDVTFVPYVDARFPLQDIDGALALDFFRGFSVFVSWDNRTYYLRPRGEPSPAALTARLARWGSALPACPHPGCVTAEVIPGDGGPSIHIVRDPEAAHQALEVGLSAGDAGDAPDAGAVPIVVEFPAGVDQLTRPISPAYEGATLSVVDVSPFPRTCPVAGGCVRQLGRTPPPPGSAAPGAVVGFVDPIVR